MTCDPNDNGELLQAYVDGQLSVLARLRVQYHLGLCGRCRQYLRRLRTASEHATPPEPMSGDVRDQLLERFK